MKEATFVTYERNLGDTYMTNEWSNLVKTALNILIIIEILYYMYTTNMIYKLCRFSLGYYYCSLRNIKT